MKTTTDSATKNVTRNINGRNQTTAKWIKAYSHFFGKACSKEEMRIFNLKLIEENYEKGY